MSGEWPNAHPDLGPRLPQRSMGYRTEANKANRSNQTWKLARLIDNRRSVHSHRFWLPVIGRQARNIDERIQTECCLQFAACTLSNRSDFYVPNRNYRLAGHARGWLVRLNTTRYNDPSRSCLTNHGVSLFHAGRETGEWCLAASFAAATWRGMAWVLHCSWTRR